MDKGIERNMSAKSSLVRNTSSSDVTSSITRGSSSSSSNSSNTSFFLLGWIGILVMFVLNFHLLVFFGWLCLLFVVGIFLSFFILSAQRQMQEGPLPSLSEDVVLTPRLRPGLSTVIAKMVTYKPREYKLDRRLTGATDIDNELHILLKLLFRDYVHTWYDGISDDPEFPNELKLLLQALVAKLASRLKEMDIVQFFTGAFVDEFVLHLRYFRQAQDRTIVKEGGTGIVGDEVAPGLVEAFFSMEQARDSLCNDDHVEKAYCRRLIETLLCLLLPEAEFDNRILRYIGVEIFALKALAPSVAWVADPDYINCSIEYYLPKPTQSYQSLIKAIKASVSIEELDVFLSKAIMELDDLSLVMNGQTYSELEGKNNTMAKDWKTQLNRLVFVKKTCERQILKLKKEDDSEPLASFHVDDILCNSRLLPFFVEYLDGQGSQHVIMIHFWLAVESFRSCSQQLRSNSSDKKYLEIRSNALDLYDLYLDELTHPRVPIDVKWCATLKEYILKYPSPNCLDQAQGKVNALFLEHYPRFEASDIYLRCVCEYELILRENAAVDEDSKLVSSSDSLDESEIKRAPISLKAQSRSSVDKSRRSSTDMTSSATWCASVCQASVVKFGLNKVAMYEVDVVKDIGTEHFTWTVARRYSDFHDLHILLRDNWPELPDVKLPGKRTFRNLNTQFLEKRRLALNNFLQTLLSNEIDEKFPGIHSFVHSFLTPGQYERQFDEFVRKIDPVIKHVKGGIRTVSTRMKTLGGDIVAEAKHFADDVSCAFEKRDMEDAGNGDARHMSSQYLTEQTKKKVADASVVSEWRHEDNEMTESIFNVLLALLDEIFELKDRNKWLRRQVIILLRQTLNQFVGDSIDRSITTAIDDSFSGAQILGWLTMFRDTMFPGDADDISDDQEEYEDVDSDIYKLAHSVESKASDKRQSVTLRDGDERQRTRIEAKNKLLGNLPQHLKGMVGDENIKRGVTRIFTMLQQPVLNKRLVYVLLESLIQSLFPDIDLDGTFKKLRKS